MPDWTRSDPFDAIVLVYTSVLGVWIVIAVFAGLWQLWSHRHDLLDDDCEVQQPVRRW